MAVVIKKGDSKEHMDELLSKVASKKIPTAQNFDASKFCGTIKLEEDALEVQKKLRDEWE